MFMKKFILCADGFGKTQDYNRAVLNGYSSGFVKSASLVANGDAFEAAINEILPECQKLTVGVQLNLTYGKALSACRYLTDIDGNFKLPYSKLAAEVQKPEFLNEIENEFRAQIEKCQASVKIYHINSVENIHSIPEIFAIVAKLADEYKIPYVRTLYEELYYVPDVKHVLNLNYLSNIFKLLKYNSNYRNAKNVLYRYDLKTNNYFLGIGYRGIMDSKALEYGLKTLADEDDFTVEAAISPCSYLRNINNNHSMEFKMTQDKILEDTICRMGYDITNHKNL